MAFETDMVRLETAENRIFSRVFQGLEANRFSVSGLQRASRRFGMWLRRRDVAESDYYQLSQDYPWPMS